MPHLPKLRKGWQNENLARFLLSRVSFVTSPSSVADDLGSDFICTLFEHCGPRSAPFLLPRNSFAIQVKSSLGTIDVSNKIDYLLNLELPFFVGVVDQAGVRLDFYSAEYLPLLFSHQGKPRRLRLALSSDPTVDPNRYFRKRGDLNFTLILPYVGTLAASDTQSALHGWVFIVNQLCARMRQNIASRSNEEHIFHVGPYGRVVTVCAGKGSAQHFRTNYYKRLTEAFANFHWLAKYHPDELVLDEYVLYREHFEALRKHFRRLPPYLEGHFAKAEVEVAKAKVDESA